MRKLSLFASALSTILILALQIYPANAADDLIKQIKERGAIRACMADSQPGAMKNPASGQWEGYNVDAGNDLAATLGVKLELVDSSWPTLVPSLQAGTCDIALVGMNRTAERAQVILFPNPWGFGTTDVTVGGDSGLSTFDDVNKPEIKISVIAGTADETIARRYFPNATIVPIVTDSTSTQFLDVANKRADATVTDSVNTKDFLTANPQFKLRLLGPPPFNPAGYSYGVPAGEYAFREFVNIWMERTETSGLKGEWWKKWTGEELPKQ
jgi:ABC-type amino acid transport substrate-binding protein